jgi:hypothetical protein
MSMLRPGTLVFSVVNDWRIGGMPTSRVATVRLPVRSRTCAPAHHGRNSGYDSMSSTTSYICRALHSTIAERAMRLMRKSPRGDRAEQESVP